MEAPHHKNTRNWQGKAIKFELPLEIVELLQNHLEWGYNALTLCSDRVEPTLFVNTNTGAPLKPQEVSKVWSKTVLEGSGVHFGPQVARSIFVVGSRDNNMPMHPGMAMLMGNSDNVWDKVYDRHFNERQAQEALATMPKWRETMLRLNKRMRGETDGPSTSNQSKVPRTDGP